MGRIPVRPHPMQVDRPLGEGVRDLVIGDMCLRLEGLEPSLSDALAHRWGPFLVPAAAADPTLRIRLFGADAKAWLRLESPGEIYRLESANDPERVTVVSYHFALCADDSPRTWRVATADQSEEPADRIVENATRYLTARLAVERGGFAMHAAGVSRDGRAYLFAGASGSGKSTAVRLAAPVASLGDDFGLVVPFGQGWRTAAVPFDNAESVTVVPPPGLVPVDGIWRLHKADDVRVEVPPLRMGIASLLGCAAFPWAMPDLADAVLENVRRYVESGGFAHLHFRKDTGFWEALQSRGAVE